MSMSVTIKRVYATAIHFHWSVLNFALGTFNLVGALDPVDGVPGWLLALVGGTCLLAAGFSLAHRIHLDWAMAHEQACIAALLDDISTRMTADLRRRAELTQKDHNHVD